MVRGVWIWSPIIHCGVALEHNHYTASMGSKGYLQQPVTISMYSDMSIFIAFEHIFTLTINTPFCDSD